MPDLVKTRILVVDDEPQITRVLRSSLAAAGYEVRTANEPEAALDLFHAWHPQVVLTDLSMPGLSGIELCQTLRTLSSVPIIVLSVKDEENVKVQALDAGADDYITKPFGMDEVLARLRAALRRSQPRPADIEQRVLGIGDFTVDIPARDVRVRNRSVHLTPKEFELLLFLLRNSGKVLTHKAVLGAVWGRAYESQPESLRVFVGQLRKKIEPKPDSPRYLITEPWIGYRFEPGE